MAVKAQDRYEEITAGFVKSLEEGLADPAGWTLPWNVSAGLPVNASTGKYYRGGNVVSFWSAAVVNSYDSPYWATYKQWAALGAQVRKGERGTYGVKWNFPTPEQRAKREAQGLKSAPFPTTFAVFNSAQVDGWTAPEVAEPLSDAERAAGADEFFKAVGAQVRTDNHAYYSPGGDYIGIPAFEDFRDAGGYYATLAHEHTHWTGAEKRLDRGIVAAAADRGGSVYAREELVAELGAAFLCAELGISPEPRPDHAQYLASWIRVLNSDSSLLWKAASAAQKAVAFLQEAAGVVPAEDNTAEAEKELVNA